MKKNNKGFMLIEAIISGTIVLTSMVLLYSTFGRLYNLYQEKNTYYNVDAIYVTQKSIDYLLENDFNKFINDTFESSNHAILIDETNCNVTNFCQDLKTLYNVNKMIITEYDKTTLENLKNTISINETFKNYINFIILYYQVGDTDTKYNYIVLTEIKEGENYYYANLGIG